jgi:hypothetical protein
MVSATRVRARSHYSRFRKYRPLDLHSSLGTGGYSSYCFFDPKGNYAGVVLLNRTIGSTGVSIANIIGEHISERFAGKPAISLPE